MQFCCLCSEREEAFRAVRTSAFWASSRCIFVFLICDSRELQRFFKCDCVTWKNTERVRPHLLSGERSSVPKDRNCGIRGLVWCIRDVQESLWLYFLIVYFLTKKVIHAFCHPTISFISLLSQEVVFVVLKWIPGKVAEGRSSSGLVPLHHNCEEKLRNSGLNHEVPLRKGIYK